MAKNKRQVLYRAVKFELKVTDEQEDLLLRISDGLREIYNWALDLRVGAYEEYKKCKQDGETNLPKPPSLFDQINLLTDLREQDQKQGLFRGHIPRNWQEETLDALDGAFKSFFALVENGDTEARPPWTRKEERFCEIPGRFSNASPVRGGYIHFAPQVFGKEMLRFPVPEEYCAPLLVNKRVKKFTIFRDEPYLKSPGRYWVSVVYEIEKPEPLAFSQENVLYLALGATWLGVLSSSREEIIKLWRPDMYWMPKIEQLNDLISRCAKGSLMWKRYMKARKKYYARMSAAQKHNQRQVVARLLRLGVHFVVQDLTIRGELADSSRPERGGTLGLNWSVQNTGSIGRLLLHLKEKAAEHGGCVIKHKTELPPASGRGAENKIPMAKRLREDFLANQTP